MVQITSIRFDFNFESRPGAGELMAFASLELDGELVVRRVRIVNYPDGRIHIFMPSRLVNDKFEDCVYPSTKELKSRIYKGILDRLGKEYAGRGDEERTKSIERVLAQADTLASGMCG